MLGLVESINEDIELFYKINSGKLEKLPEDITLKKITGKAEFEYFPGEKDEVFEFIIVGRSRRRAKIKLDFYSCDNTLKNGEKYEFYYVDKDGVCLVFKYEMKTNSKAEEDIDCSLEDIERRLFEVECAKKRGGIKVHFDIDAKAFCLRAENNGETTLDISYDGKNYKAVIDSDMGIDSDTEIRVAEMLESTMAKHDGNTVVVRGIEYKGLYNIKGVFVGGVLYIRELANIGKEGFFRAVHTKEKFEKIKFALDTMSESMKDELISYGYGRKVYPYVNENKISRFAHSNSLRMKFDLCQVFYPENVQAAIIKTFEDKSLKDNQRTEILNLLVNTVWGKEPKYNTDTEQISAGLDETHFGLNQLKRELMKLVVSNSDKKSKKGASILIVGAPGTGKTSLVKRFAQLYNIPFEKVSLNSIDTPYFLKGTPRLYDNAILGHIMRVIGKVGDRSMILLDEVDKMSDSGEDGNPYSALYDLLDRESLFVDNMIECGIDLSDVIFVLTANDISDVPPAILDRVEVIYASDYTAEEKIKITEDYVIPKIMEEYSLEKGDISWSREAIELLANRYTLTNGVRDIERNVLRIVKSAVLKKRKKPDRKIKITAANAAEFSDLPEADRKSVERSIAGIKNKFKFFKDEYSDSVKSRVISLLSKYETASKEERDVLLRRLTCLVNILPGETETEFDMRELKELMDKSHYGLDEVKEQILMQVSARCNAKENITKCILLNGMSGIGKTTICKTLAEGMKMPFVKISLNGVSSPESISGFEPVWKGAEPGVVASNLAQLGTSSAFILLDEIDKMSRSDSKDPYSALLDLLDNAGGFYDRFLGAAIDISSSFIVATSNYIENIPVALIDRMEVIELGGYNAEEKKKIAADYIIPKKLGMYNLTGKVFFCDKAVDCIVDEYCGSYGMRDVEKCVEKIICKILLGGSDKIVAVDAKKVTEYLGAGELKRGNMPDTVRSGVARALAVSGNSGLTFAVEITSNPYGEADEVTGLPKQSTLDSIKIAKLLISKRLGKPLEKMHIHFAEGGIEKDGPSAGITIFSAMLSYCLDMPVDTKTGFTGEIDIYGDVWAVGGVELKLTAAQREGCTRVFIPYDNYQQLKADGKLSRYKCSIIPVKNVDEIAHELFEESDLKKVI